MDKVTTETITEAEAAGIKVGVVAGAGVEAMEAEKDSQGTLEAEATVAAIAGAEALINTTTITITENIAEAHHGAVGAKVALVATAAAVVIVIIGIVIANQTKNSSNRCQLPALHLRTISHNVGNFILMGLTNTPNVQKI